MIVFSYDKTFEGLLSAVFDMYDRKTVPQRLIGEGEPEPMFTERLCRIETDKRKADRVWAGVQKRLPREVCNMLMHVWLSEMPGSDELLLRYLQKVFGGGASAAVNFADDDILQTQRIARKVSKEALYLIQFVRFQKAEDGTFFAPVSPRYNALPLVVNHFTDRFADQKWMIYDLKRRYGYYYDLHTVVEITPTEEDTLPGITLTEEQMAEDEQFFQELWRSYFKALTIRERINPKLHRRNMPRRFWKYLTEKQ